jgi:ATP-dependent RNA helicase RhlE
VNSTTFQEFDFDNVLRQTLATQKFDTPTPVQLAAIPSALEGRDILASAQTGSGKTAAFVLPILHRLSRERARPEKGLPRALILAPTRELAGQIAEVITIFSRNLRLSSAVIYGGVGKGPQIQALRRGVDIVVATPGRLLDLMGERYISLKRVNTIVLDEADRMLDMGFIPDVKRIIRDLPTERQSLFFSATLPGPVVELADQLLTNPVRVSVEKTKANTPDINQQVMFVQRGDKRDALRMILTEYGSYRALVFTRTKHRARDLAKYLGKNGIASDDLHGNKSQNARTRALTAFHKGKIQVLVATDIASRGIDVDDIDHVINFELPNESESYVHRIGRTARAGKAGVALSFCDESEVAHLTLIQKELSLAIPVSSDHPYHAAAVQDAATRAAQPRQRTGGAGRTDGAGRPGGRGRPAGKPRAGGGSRGSYNSYDSSRGGAIGGRGGAAGHDAPGAGNGARRSRGPRAARPARSR